MSLQKILLVDDSLDIHELVQIWLGEEPVTIHLLENGLPTVDEAVRLQPDLILLDVDLPDLNGFDVCRRLKANPLTADISVIFLTGAATTEEKLLGLELGATDYITKPFDPAELRARVRSALHTKRLMDELALKARTIAESEERFRVLAENSSDVIARHLGDGTYVYASPAAETVLGEPPASLQGRSLFERIHADDVAAVTDCYFKARHAGETGTVIFRYHRRDGRLIWIESTCRTLIDPATGRVREVHASSRDITARKQMEMREQVRAHVLEMIAQDLPLQDVFRCLADTAEQQEPDALAAGVMLSRGAVQHFAPNLPKQLANSIEQQMLQVIERLEAIGSKQADRVILCNPATDPAWAALHEQVTAIGLKACWAVLIRNRRREAIGAFVLYSRHQRPLTSANGELLKLSGELIEVAVEQRILADALAYQAQHDTLTGLANRGRFNDCLQQTVALAARTKQPAALLLIDVDRFKQVNDTYGHQAGDAMLCAVAQRLGTRLRATDILARIGGDEFAAILTTVADPQDAHRVALELVEEFTSPVDIAGQLLPISVSIGSAVAPTDGADVATLITHADLALYEVKEAGRNGARAYVPAMAAQAA